MQLFIISLRACCATVVKAGVDPHNIAKPAAVSHQSQEHGIGASSAGTVSVRKPELRHILHVSGGLAVHAPGEHTVLLPIYRREEVIARGPNSM